MGEHVTPTPPPPPPPPPSPKGIKRRHTSLAKLSPRERKSKLERLVTFSSERIVDLSENEPVILQSFRETASSCCFREVLDEIICTKKIFTLGGCGNKSPPFESSWNWPMRSPASTMKGEILGECPIQNQKDIYFLETNLKSESANLANLFAPSNENTPSEMSKCKPRLKLKQKLYPTLEFFVQNKSSNVNEEAHCRTDSDDEKCSNKSDEEAGPSNNFDNNHRTTATTTSPSSESRRNSLDLYREAAAILGLSCQQTDDCKCLECQCHYFDFDEEIDFTATGGEYLMTSGVSGTYSSCSIQ